MNDIHMHIIPCVDDGAKNIAMSMEMLKMAEAQGIKSIIATPHDYAFYNNGNKIFATHLTLQKIFPKIKLYIGCEIYCEPEAMKCIIADLKSKIIPTMNNTQYVLVEFYTKETDFEKIMYCVKKLLKYGYIPIIAHIERYSFFSIENMLRLKGKGCMLQANVFSLKEEENSITKANARLALQEKLIDFLGSDAHRTNHRPPNVKSGLNYLNKIQDTNYVYSITKGNAKKYLGVR